MSVKLRKNNNFFHFLFASCDIPCNAVFTVGGESRTNRLKFTRTRMAAMASKKKSKKKKADKK